MIVETCLPEFSTRFPNSAKAMEGNSVITEIRHQCNNHGMISAFFFAGDHFHPCAMLVVYRICSLDAHELLVDLI